MDNNDINKQEITEQELFAAMAEFAGNSHKLVGGKNTYMTLKFMTGLIDSNPAVYQKLFKPENLQEIQKLVTETTGKKPSLSTAMAMIPRIQKIFK